MQSKLIGEYSIPEVLPDRPKCYFDISIGGQPAFRLVFELYNKELPVTCGNFYALCKGNLKTRTGTALTYNGSSFHRIITSFMAQGGDFTAGNGTGGLSIYGEKFKDEGFPFKHTSPGMLSMANAGKNTNGSQFFLTFVVCDWLDGKHVVFGRTVEGQEYLKVLEGVGSQSGKPSKIVKIVACGVLE